MGENNLEKKLTINDIAQMSGVAKSTVSRYLNGGSVKDATAQKIKKIIEENNYEPNLFAICKFTENLWKSRIKRDKCLRYACQ